MLKNLESIVVSIAVLGIACAFGYWFYTRSQANTATAADATSEQNYNDQLTEQALLEQFATSTGDGSYSSVGSPDVVAAVSGTGSSSTSVASGTTASTPS